MRTGGCCACGCLVIALEGELYLVLHLMIAGRLRWQEKPPKRITLALFEFESGTLAFTEAGTKRRASLHFVQGRDALRTLDAGGIEVLESDFSAFSFQLQKENHTLKRALTDPRLFAGIGNAYSDEILHRAKLSPLAMTQSLSEEGDCTPARRYPGNASLLDGAAAQRGRQGVPGKSNGVPGRHGRAWPPRQALPRLRRAGAAIDELG